MFLIFKYDDPHNHCSKLVCIICFYFQMVIDDDSSDDEADESIITAVEDEEDKASNSEVPANFDMSGEKYKLYARKAMKWCKMEHEETLDELPLIVLCSQTVWVKLKAMWK